VFSGKFERDGMNPSFNEPSKYNPDDQEGILLQNVNRMLFRLSNAESESG